jgi:secernin
MKRILILIFLLIFALLLAVWTVLGCDTWIALKDAALAKRILFAKNSDRTVFDSQPLFLQPRRDWPARATIDLGRISIPQAKSTYATLGSSPYWCWGYEEGINEFSVVIGNEGVFTKPLLAALAAAKEGKEPAPGPTGMDFVRLGLERGRTAREALHVIAGLVERYGQFGSGLPAMGVEGAYDNSFLIADPQEAWILETAGTLWAAKKINQGVASISNVLSIAAPDLSSPDLVAQAERKGWWKANTQGLIDFSVAFRADTPEHEAAQRRALIRAGCSLGLLREKSAAVDEAWMKRISRDRSTDPSLDLDVTASACVAALPASAGELPVFWWCASVPSGGVFIPFFIHGSTLPSAVSTAGTFGRRIVPPDRAAPDGFAAQSFWWLFRDLNDKINFDRPARLPLVRAAFDALEHAFAADLPAVLEKASALRKAKKEAEAAAILDAFSAACVDQATARVNELRRRFEPETGPLPANIGEFAGAYIATFGSFNEAEWTIEAKDGRLILNIPGRPVLELMPPDKDGIWRLAASPQAGVSFLRDEKAGVYAMTFRQGANAFELPKKGVILPPAIPLENLQKYLGRYYGEKLNETLEIVIRNNALALKTPEKTYELRPPDAERKWRFRVADVAAVRFEETADGAVTGFTYFEGVATLIYKRECKENCVNLLE